MQRLITILLISGLLVVSCHRQVQPRFSSADLIKVENTIESDSLVEAYMAPLRDSIESVMNEIIGQSQAQMVPEKPESPLSHFVADLLQEEALKEIREINKDPLPTLTVINIKGLRAPLPKGDITVRDIYSLMPFENQLIILKLSGREIFQLFKHMGNSRGDGLSGASFSFKDQTVINPMVAGEPLQENQFYYVVTSDYLANGGDHYTVFAKAREKYTSPQKIRDIIIYHIRELTKKGKSIDPPHDTRIRLQ